MTPHLRGAALLSNISARQSAANLARAWAVRDTHPQPVELARAA